MQNRLVLKIHVGGDETHTKKTLVVVGECGEKLPSHSPTGSDVENRPPSRKRACRHGGAYFEQPKKQATPAKKARLSPPKARKAVHVSWPKGWAAVGGEEPVERLITTHNDIALSRMHAFEAALRLKDKEIFSVGDDVIVKYNEGKKVIKAPARITSFIATETDVHATILWYYTTDMMKAGSTSEISVLPNELFASRHIDVMCLSAIMHKATVITGEAFNRYTAERARPFPWSLLPPSEEFKRLSAVKKVYVCRYAYKFIKGELNLKKREQQRSD